MALLLSQTMDDGRVVTYHRVAEVSFKASPIVRFSLESFESDAARADPAVVPVRREFDFPYIESGITVVAAAYNALIAAPEWSSAVSDDPASSPGPHPAKPAGTDLRPITPQPRDDYKWDPVAGDWVRDVYFVIAAHRQRIQVLGDYFLYGFGFSYTPPGSPSSWFVHTTEWNLRRIEAIAHRLAAAPSIDTYIVFGSPAAEVFQPNPLVLEAEVSRAEALIFCRAASSRVEQVTRQRQYQLTVTRQAEILAASQPAQALVDIDSLISAGWVNPTPPPA
ncbi:MAG: hypothetical protein EOP38_26860 [Rubrivivax sp.]|nr:MAG: hypothetical protein EOP38_26860 [Rubrivivax sp.]